MQARIDCIRENIRNKNYRFSSHCISRMGSRKIWKNDALDAILFGELLEVQEPTKDSPETHFLFQENSQSPEFCVVVAESKPILEIITVFYFYETIWEFNGVRYQRRAIK